MAYIEPDAKSGADLKRRLAAGETFHVFQPGPFPLSPHKGKYVNLEGPHYPKPHSWYVIGEIDPDTNQLTKVLTNAEVKKAYR